MAISFVGAGAPLSAAGFEAARSALGADAAALWAVLQVETRGFGFQRDRRPKILFERHVFHRRTGGRFSAAHPDISRADAGGYGSESAQYARLEKASALDARAALESASWGLGQIMGFNATKVGYADAAAMVSAFKQSEDEQLAASARFIDATPAMAKALRGGDWARFAFYYNGEHYRRNDYDGKLERYHRRFAATLPDIEVRAGQARLAYLGYEPRGIDGEAGGNTRLAVLAFQRDTKMAETGMLDAATAAALKAAAGV